jgi:DNA-binding GntR family transcriptional regulator
MGVELLGNNIDILSRSATISKVLEEMRIKIILHEYKPDARIIEANLAEEYQVSRVSIRAALQALESEGMIEALSNGGKKVICFRKKDLLDMYEVRKMHECKAIELIISNKVVNYAPFLSVLDNINDYHNNAVDLKKDVFCDLDIQFHRAILLMSQNRPLMQSWEVTSSVMSSLLNLNTLDWYKENYMEELYFKHKTILDCIITNKDKAIEVVAEHIDVAKEISLKILEQHGIV